MSNHLSAIKQIEMLAKRIPEAISLAQGIPDNYSHQLIRQATIAAIKNSRVDKYTLPNGLPELRQLVSQQLALEKMSYDPETEIIVTAGAIEGLSATLLTLLEPGDEIIIPTPTYNYYRHISELKKARPVEIKLDETNGWSLDIQSVKKAISKHTKVLIICNPNNPTGTVYSQQQQKELGQLAQEHNFYLVIDSVYEYFYYPTPPTAPNGKVTKIPFNICQVAQHKSQIIRVVSLSKHFCLTGWRIGYLHGPQNLIQQILPTHDSLINCAPVVSQYAAIAALINSKQIISENTKKYHKKRLIIGQTLNQLSKYISFTWPQGAYYFFPKLLHVKKSEDFCFDLLNKAKLATVPGSEFGPGGESHFRLCFGRSEQDIIEGMNRLKKYFLSNY
jgi:aminotransferase